MNQIYLKSENILTETLGGKCDKPGLFIILKIMMKKIFRRLFFKRNFIFFFDIIFEKF